MKKIIHYSLFIIHFFLFLLPTTNLMGQTAKTWTGAVSTNWNIAGNWNPSGVPIATSVVTIPNLTNDPVLSQNVSIATLTLQSGVPLNFGGFTLTATGTATIANSTLSNGNLVCGGFSSNGATVGVSVNNGSGNLSISGTNTFAQAFTATAATVTIANATFNGITQITKTGTTSDICLGKITCNAAMTYRLTGTGSLFIEGLSGDVYNSTLDLRTTSSGSLVLNRKGSTTCNGKVTINSTAGITSLSSSSAVAFNLNADIEIIGSNANIWINKINHQSGKKIIPITAANFSGGTLQFRDYVQLGSDSISILGQNGARLQIERNCVFLGKFTSVIPSLVINGGTFNGITSLTKTGTATDQNNGGYTFANKVKIKANAGKLILAFANTVNTYLEETTFEATGGTINPSVSGAHDFKNNLILSGTSVIGFSTGGTISFTGNVNQTLSRINSFNVNILNLTVNKPAGSLNLLMPITVDGQLTLTSGIISTTAANLLNLNTSAIVLGGGQSSYVEGPIVKIGAAAFTFPTGRNGRYKPISITAPTTSSTFRAEYSNKTAADGRPFTSKDASINRISSNEHWQLQRTAGTANVQPTVTWDNMSCQFDNMANLRLTAWNGSTWKDLGNGGTTGTTTTGTIKTTSTSSIYGYYTLATTDTFRCVKCEADAGEDKTVEKFSIVLLGNPEINNSTINWLPSDWLLENNMAQVKLNAINSQIYKKQVTNSQGCLAIDYVSISIIPNNYLEFIVPCVSHE